MGEIINELKSKNCTNGPKKKEMRKSENCETLQLAEIGN